MNARIVRSTLTVVVLMAFLIRVPVLALLVLVGWGIAESFRFAKGYGRTGHAAFSIFAAIIVTFFGFQSYIFGCNHVLITKIEGFGSSYAAMSGQVLPGPVKYISLGPDVGDAELAKILALNGLDNLDSLVANRSQITDQGLLTLQRFKRLNHIYIGETKVTPHGVAELQRLLPDCLIVYDPDG